MEQLTLSLPEGVLFTARKLTVPRGLSPEQYLDLGRYLSKARGSLALWIADWREDFRREHGDEAVRAALAQLHFEGEDWRAVESLNAAHERCEGLSVEHNFILGKAKTAEDRAMWGELATKEKLSPKELQLSIRLGTVTRIEPAQSGGVNAGVASLEAITGAFRRYRAQVGEQYLAWQSATKDEVRAEVGPMLEFFREALGE